MKPISLQMWTVRNVVKELGFEAVVKQIAEIGYKAIEGGMNKEPAQMKKLLDSLGLQSSSAHMPLPKADNINLIVENCKTLGYEWVITGYGPDSFKTMDGIKKTAGDFQNAAMLLKPHGLKLLYHNHWWEMNDVEGKLGLDWLYELAPDLLAQIDTYWASNFGKVDVPALVKRYAKRSPLLHIKDGPLVQGQPHTAAGKGKMDIPAIVAAADQNVLKWLVVELDECGTDMMQAVADSYKYLTATTKLAVGNK